MRQSSDDQSKRQDRVNEYFLIFRYAYSHVQRKLKKIALNFSIIGPRSDCISIMNVNVCINADEAFHFMRYSFFSVNFHLDFAASGSWFTSARSCVVISGCFDNSSAAVSGNSITSRPSSNYQEISKFWIVNQFNWIIQGWWLFFKFLLLAMMWDEQI